MLGVGYGERIKTARDGLKLSQVELGHMAGVNKETVNRVERENNARVDTLRKVSAALGLTLIDLFAEGSVLKCQTNATTSPISTHQAGDNVGPSLEARLREVEEERNVYRAALENIQGLAFDAASDIGDIIVGVQTAGAQPPPTRLIGRHRGSSDRDS